jgi:hypothetical protein
MINAYSYLILRRKIRGRTHRWDVNIEVFLREIGCGGVN